MRKSYDKLQAEHSKLASRLKGISKSAVLAQHKALDKALNACWTREDAVKAALKKARDAGRPVPTEAAARKDSDVGRTIKAWEAQCAVLADTLKALLGCFAEGKSLLPQLSKQESEAAKLAKASSKDASLRKDTAALHATIRTALADAKAAAQGEGKLHPPEKLYAANAKRTLAKLIADAPTVTEATATVPAELELKPLTKTFKQMSAQAKAIQGQCQAAARAPDPDAAEAAFSDARKTLASLVKRVQGYQKLRKKEAQSLKADPDGRKIIKLLDGFDKQVKQLSAELLHTQKALRARAG